MLLIFVNIGAIILINYVFKFENYIDCEGEKMSEKKVLILNPYLPTLGGGEKHMGYLCQCIEEYYNFNVQIDILVHNYNEVDIYDPNYITIDDVNNQFGLNLKKTSIRKVDTLRAVTKKEYYKNKKMIENITKEYDFFINFMFLSKHIGKAKINMYQCMFPSKKYITELNQNLLLRIIAKHFDKQFFKSYDSIVSNSKFTDGWLKRYWQPDKKEVVIYPPVFNEDEIEGRYIESAKKNIIISVGRFFVADHSKKQLDMAKFFVNNNEVFKNYEYHLVGAVSNLPADIEYLQQIKDLAATVDNVFVHENCKYADLMELYKQAKIFWHGTGYGVDEEKEPNKMEHFGITTVEAMSFGAVPVVISKGGQKETVEDGVNGYRWLNEEECVKYTKILIDDDEKRRQMAEVSVERAKDYSIESFYRKHIEVFDELHI